MGKAEGASKSWKKARTLAKKLGIGVAEARGRIAAEKKSNKPGSIRVTAPDAPGDGFSALALLAASKTIEAAGGVEKAQQAIKLVEKIQEPAVATS